MISKAESICQEFCDEVYQTDFATEVEEIKCRVDIKYFTPLTERMIEVGYCCTQVQKDLEGHLCTVWFEPQRCEDIV